tara:strand:- start:4757 stop:5398 length:642 start_codon:yes stop_codon:yes gene_type:complete
MVWQAALAIANAGLGFLGKQQEQRAANRAAINNFKRQEEARERDWNQALSIWGARTTKYEQDIDEGNLAAARGYEQAQEGLNRTFETAIQNNEKAFIQYLKKHGQQSAAGRTGRSIGRINTLDIAELERFAGKQAFAMTRSQEAFKENVESIRRAAVANKNNLFANVAFAPVPDAAPPPPVTSNNTLGLLAGLVSAGVSGVSTYRQFGGEAFK